MIRELHVYGEAVALGEEQEGATQHKGYGKKLVAKAEEIAKQNDFTKLLVISGIGVRKYYEKLGFTKEEPYMAKNL